MQRRILDHTVVSQLVEEKLLICGGEGYTSELVATSSHPADGKTESQLMVTGLGTTGQLADPESFGVSHYPLNVCNCGKRKPQRGRLGKQSVS